MISHICVRSQELRGSALPTRLQAAIRTGGLGVTVSALQVAPNHCLSLRPLPDLCSQAFDFPLIQGFTETTVDLGIWEA